MNKAQKSKIILKFRNSLQKLAYIMQQIVFDEGHAEAERVIDNAKKKASILTQSALREQEVRSNLSEEIRDEIASLVESDIIRGYSPIVDMITSERPTQADVDRISKSLKLTKRSLLEIPDRVEAKFADKKPNIKILNSCVGLEIEKQNNKNFEASNELLEKLDQRNTEKLSQKEQKL